MNDPTGYLFSAVYHNVRFYVLLGGVFVVKSECCLQDPLLAREDSGWHCRGCNQVVGANKGYRWKSYLDVSTSRPTMSNDAIERLVSQWLTGWTNLAVSVTLEW